MFKQNVFEIVMGTSMVVLVVTITVMAVVAAITVLVAIVRG